MPKMSPSDKPQSKVLTSAKILDAAELLFGQNGFDAVSVRQIADAAGVELGLIHYHFGSKENVLRSVLQRRASIVNDFRLARLGSIPPSQKGKERAAVEAIVDAWSRPLLELSVTTEPGWLAYMRLICLTGLDSRWSDLMNDLFNDVAETTMAALHGIYPELSREQMYPAYYLMVGSITVVFAGSNRLEMMSEGRFQPSDLHLIYPCLLPYVTGGLMSMFEATRAAAPGPRLRARTVELEKRVGGPAVAARRSGVAPRPPRARTRSDTAR